VTAPSGKIVAPFKWTWAPSDTDQDRIRILGGWPQLNITSFACEPLARWTKNRSRIVTLNHSVKEPFLKLWEAWEKEDLLELLTESLERKGQKPAWAGGWVPRYKRGAAHDQNPRNLSTHASGHAFDICPTAYPLGKAVPPEDIMHALADVAKEHGWFWGGKFASRPDGMHFQHVSSPFP
jgi:hypothetical protein